MFDLRFIHNLLKFYFVFIVLFCSCFLCKAFFILDKQHCHYVCRFTCAPFEPNPLEGKPMTPVHFVVISILPSAF